MIEELRGNRTSMAIVLDEYGAVAGLVTLEDLLEQLVGPIDDEHDVPASADPIRPLGGSRFEVDASLPLEVLNERLGLHLPTEDDFETDRRPGLPRSGPSSRGRGEVPPQRNRVHRPRRPRALNPPRPDRPPARGSRDIQWVAALTPSLIRLRWFRVPSRCLASQRRFGPFLPRTSRQGVGHDPAGDRAAEVAVPGDVRAELRNHSQDQRAAVEEADQNRHEERHDSLLQESGQDEERCQARRSGRWPRCARPAARRSRARTRRAGQSWQRLPTTRPASRPGESKAPPAESCCSADDGGSRAGTAWRECPPGRSPSAGPRRSGRGRERPAQEINSPDRSDEPGHPADLLADRVR